jgi:hypothetical protein
MNARPLLESAPQNRRLRPTLNTHRFIRAATPSLAAIAASLACLPLAHAQVDSWIAASGSWSNPGNWSAGTLPTTNDLVVISNTDNVNRTVNYDYTGGEQDFTELFITNSGGGIDTLAMTTAATTPPCQQR